MSLKLVTFAALAFIFKLHRAEGIPAPKTNATAPENVLSKLGSLFKVGPGMMVFNSQPSNSTNDTFTYDDDEIICAERSAGKSYCTEVPNYLRATQLDKIDSAQFEQFRAFFKDDFMQPQNVTNRMNDEREEYFCDSKSHIIYPKSVESKRLKWLLVVQHAQHKQGVLVEQCENENIPCKYNDMLPLGISSKCKQHYTYRSLVVLVNGVMKEELVRLPNYCECVLRFNLPRRT